jgi:hypothetical protein
MELVRRKGRFTGQGDTVSRTTKAQPIPPVNPLISRAQRKFLHAFPGGFRDDTYVDWERDYKWKAHRRWQANLSEAIFRRLVADRQFKEVGRLASSIESRTNLLFSFEKMALRDAIRSDANAQAFATALFDLLYGKDSLQIRFAGWVAALCSATASNARLDLAASNRVRLPRPAQAAFLLQANRDAGSLATLRRSV